ncbi:MAG: hypothetical protein FWH43_00500 [Endomicrobia bacterium]|nr:hypothetical protein [Endomicrobiia bacterium]
MTYGNAPFLCIYPKLHIEAYKKQLNGKTSPKLHDYYDDFINFTKKHEHFEIDEEMPSGNYSGIIITGFGEDEIYPSLINLRLHDDSVSNLIYEKVEEARIAVGNFEVKIITNAQNDVFSTLFDGVSPALFKSFLEQINTALLILIKQVQSYCQK